MAKTGWMIVRSEVVEDRRGFLGLQGLLFAPVWRESWLGAPARVGEIDPDAN
jgi:hypothetical protein